MGKKEKDFLSQLERQLLEVLQDRGQLAKASKLKMRIMQKEADEQPKVQPKRIISQSCQV